MKKKPQPMSLRAYARRRKVSHVAVMKAIERGRLSKSLERKDGHVRIADPKLADREWTANTDLTRAHDDVKIRAAAAALSAPATFLEPQAHGGALKRTSADVDRESDNDVDDREQDAAAHVDAALMVRAAAREKHFRAELMRLKFEQADGTLANAEETRSEWVSQIITWRTRLLGIANKAKQRLSHLSVDDVGVIDAIVREALEELVADEESGAPS